MRCRRLLALAIFTLAFISLIAWRTAQQPEPSFDGKPLSFWIDELDRSPPPSEKAIAAIRKIGPNAISYSLELLRAKDPSPLLPRFAYSLGFQTRPSEESHYRATRIFEVLNTNAAPAVPALIEILQRNYSDSSRSATLGCLSYIGPAAESALPFIVQHANDPYPLARYNAIQGIGEIGGMPRLTVPVLTRALSDPQPTIRYCALFALRAHGSRARSAVPEIQKLWKDACIITNTYAPDRAILTNPVAMTDMVGQALWAIAPDTTPHALLVRCGTSIVTNSATTIHFKAEFEGKRHLLIPSGTPTPVAWHRWRRATSDPFITLYLSSTDAETDDILLGRFEIPSVREAGRDIRWACTIADGKIYLAARDNHRGQFIPIQFVPE